ncbi:hypothetical protein [Bacillus amyloliquefaciens]|uniref:hypothetical protein n=1 Tax=Bacillus amyloliquefaciens TaxID=1390 RepID=UPI000E276820|nr:hypothetical protein [Bacillus amyloliquefaciens]RDY88561.1 hypothetical protein C3733_07450 [Bacillus amyloliquefaciens]
MLGNNFSWSGILTMEPTMVGAYVLVGGVGLLCIGSGWLESKLFDGRFSYVSNALTGLLNIGLPVAYLSFLIRFLTSL